jgi:hypothetical protein
MNDMDGDEVNSIGDTTESQQVANIVKQSYFELMANRNWPHMRTAFNCTAYGSTSQPTSLVLPDNIKELEWIKYNKRKSTDTKDKSEDIVYLQPEEFFNLVAGRDSSEATVQVVTINGMRLNIKNDKAPQYWTTFDDSVLVCDSWDSAVDSILQTGKNSCWGVRNPSWSHLDGSYPELPDEAFPSLIEEAKSTCFYVLRQTVNEKAEQKATRQARWLSRKAWRAKGGVKYPNYGRKKAFTGTQKNPLFDKN